MISVRPQRREKFCQVTTATKNALSRCLVHKAQSLRPTTLHKIIATVDGIRRPSRFEDFLVACEADARGRKGLEERAYPQAEILRCALHAARAVRTDDVENAPKGQELGELIRLRQIEAIATAIKTN